MLAIIIELLLILQISSSARILGIVPTPSYSHQIVHRALWTELSLRGHKVTVMTTDPVKSSSLTNLTEIDLHEAYDILKKHDIVHYMAKYQHEPMKLVEKIRNFTEDLLDYEMLHPQVQELKNSTFDLVMAETVFLPPFAFSEVFNCPVIAIASIDVMQRLHQEMGNPTNPVTYPDQNLAFFGQLSFWERVKTSSYTTINQLIHGMRVSLANKLVRKYFGEGLPSIDEILQRMNLMFLNLNPALNVVRPVSPSTIFIGGSTHLQDPKPLPQVDFLNLNEGLKIL